MLFRFFHSAGAFAECCSLSPRWSTSTVNRALHVPPWMSSFLHGGAFSYIAHEARRDFLCFGPQDALYALLHQCRSCKEAARHFQITFSGLELVSLELSISVSVSLSIQPEQVLEIVLSGGSLSTTTSLSVMISISPLSLPSSSAQNTSVMSLSAFLGSLSAHLFPVSLCPSNQYGARGFPCCSAPDLAV